MKSLIAAACGLLVSLQALAQSDAAARGEEIAAALNRRDAETMLRMVDVGALGSLMMKDLGLSGPEREALGKGLAIGVRNSINLSMRMIEGSKGSARFLRTGMRDARTYALLRLDLGEQGTDYVDYYLTPSGLVEDWYLYSQVNLFSTSVRLNLATMLKTDSMLFALFGMRAATGADLKPFNEMRERLQAQDFAGAYRALEKFPEEFRKTRHWAVMRATYAGRIDDATHRAALRHLAQNFGNDADLQFMLVDHYVYEGQLDRALASVGALERAIGGEDAATANLRGRILTGAKRYDDAAKACSRGMALEPDHKPVYWCLVEVGLDSNNGRLTVEGLSAYEKAFGVEFDPAKLAAMEPYKAISRTPEFAAWAKKRR